MRFGSLVLKASPGALGLRQLVDVPIGAKYRVAKTVKSIVGSSIEVLITYSVCRDEWNGSRVVPKAFVVIDPTEMNVEDIAEFEDNRGFDFGERGGERPKGVKLLQHVITAGTVIVYEAV